MLALVLAEAGQDREQAQLVDRRPVDPADERPREPVHQRVAEAPSQQAADGVVAVDRSAREEEVQPHPHLLGPREQAGRRERDELRREDEREAVGHRDESVAAEHVDGARIHRADEVAAEPQLAAELRGGRPDRDERIRPLLDDEPVAEVRPNLAAEAVGGLEERRADASLAQDVRGREPGDPSPDDDGPHRPPFPPRTRPPYWTGGTYGQRGSLSSGSPVHVNARAREPPQRALYSQRPQRPLKVVTSRSCRNTSLSR